MIANGAMDREHYRSLKVDQCHWQEAVNVGLNPLHRLIDHVYLMMILLVTGPQGFAQWAAPADDIIPGQSGDHSSSGLNIGDIFSATFTWEQDGAMMEVIHIAGIVMSSANKKKTHGQRLESDDRSQITTFTLIVPDVQEQTVYTLANSIQAIANTTNREFHQNWQMHKICRVRAGILPGPIAGLAQMNDVQVTQLHGDTENPARVTRRECHSKAEKLLVLVAKIIDMKRIPEFVRGETAELDDGVITQVTSPESPRAPSPAEVFLRLNSLAWLDGTKQ